MLKQKIQIIQYKSKIMSTTINNEQTNKIYASPPRQCVLSKITQYRPHNLRLPNSWGYLKEVISFTASASQLY